ncbi:MAG: hypothetical protein P4L45_06575, partial [Ignavibacteriaceae bacterium]|nr:hypothetical protein [Ignavibacteriaceae bacterium]
MNKYINKTFSKPDEWIACIDLGEDKVYGKIKDGKALLERIPSPNTGYRFNDIVEIGTPIGKTFIRDDEILVYQAIKVVTPSNLSTFSFEVIIPNSEAWGDLHEIAESFNAIIEVEYKIKYEGKKWTTGYCVTPNIKVLKSILEIFVISGNNRKVKNVKQEFENHDILIDEIKGEDFILELKYPIKVDGVLFAILLLPLLLLMLEVLKLGIKTISDVFGFLVMLLIMIVLDAYIVIK